MELAYYTQKRNEMHIMRVLNKKYWPYHIAIENKHRTVFIKAEDAERWCYSKFKSSNWRNVGPYFAFKQEHDALMFTLRWSS